jgi:hypothetical protein
MYKYNCTFTSAETNNLLTIMKTLTIEQQVKQNNDLLNTRLSNMMSRTEVLQFCKRAKIEVCCDLVDSDVQDAFLDYYGVLPLWSSNNEMFSMIKLN